MADVNGKNVFLCGPMTGIYAYNVDGFAWAHKMLVDKGAAHVFDPAYEWYTSLDAGHERDAHDECMLRTVSELTTTKDGGKAFYDMVITLDDWQSSDGACTEVYVAMSCGIPVCDLADVISD